VTCITKRTYILVRQEAHALRIHVVDMHAHLRGIPGPNVPLLPAAPVTILICYKNVGSVNLHD